MGLLLEAKGFDEEIFNSSYSAFTRFRTEIAKAYNTELGELYQEQFKVWFLKHEDLPKEKLERLGELGEKGLGHLLFHSDCDGKLTPKQCKEIYMITKDLVIDFPQTNYMTPTGKNQLEVFNRALLHCWKKRVNMYFL